MKNLIAFTSSRHLLSNVIFWGLILMAIFVWFRIGKEELPEFSSNWIRVTTTYPGAPASDVELFVTKPLEDELKGVVGIEEIVTTSSTGTSSVRIVLDDDYPNKDEVTQEIKDAILRARLPSEVRDIPRMRQFKSAAKAILDIGIYHKDHRFLDQSSRSEVQKYILSFESQILALKEISSVSRSHYRKPELQIMAKPEEILKKEISLSEIKDQIQKNNIRVPIGSMNDRGESKVTAVNELETVSSLNNLILRGNYEGYGLKLGDLAHIQNGFVTSNSIFKINGHEGVFLNIKKNISTDILTAQAAVMDFIQKFKKANANAPIEIALMDDESYAVTNRLDIVTTNGLLGFVFIVFVLVLFLDLKSGFWVGMGIPFSISFTLIIASIVGYTVNNMTLAGIIIVLGIVVDDAIIVAENISRKIEEGMPLQEAAVCGTTEVIKPIIASVLTTCVAFVPLIYFEGFFGKLVSYIPLIVILMLAGSLIESLLIFPAHISGSTFWLDRFARKTNQRSWFYRFEKIYESALLIFFKLRIPILLCFVLLLIGSGFLYKAKLKFVMFPREESKEVHVKVKADPNFIRVETAKAIIPLEEMFVKEKLNVVAVRSRIGRSRRGGVVKENEASILVELIPKDDRPDSLNLLLKRWEKQSKNLPGLKQVKFLRGRWGHASGNAIELQVQENNDKSRAKIASMIKQKMQDMKDVVDVEVDEPIMKNEFLFHLKQDRLIKYDVSPTTVTSTLRSFVEGSILYSINKGEEEVDVRLSVPEASKNDLNELLNLRVENKTGKLTYLKNIVEVKEVKRPINIRRTDFKRTTLIYANPAPNSSTTPLQIAQEMENNVFPEITNQFPTAILSFKGEIEDTRESQGEFRSSIIMVVILIYLILVIMFNSLFKPLMVLSVVPFGLAGVIYILYFHNMSVYGFFAAVGALGMVGVVINDAIVMIDKIERTFKQHKQRTHAVIATVSATRLRPVIVTTVTTVVAILPTAYGLAGYDSMLAEMMLTMGWGLAFGTCITLILIPSLYSFTASD
ncbi:MAG: efflux RND transporter permease subunit [Bacteriovoracaceae bacterium]|nr:efflux RND transporter permease subunit [Bacteriovoracaceae bacterium]